MTKVDVIARTFEANDDNKAGFDPEVISRDMKIISGKAAGICYSDDNYLSEGMNDVDKAIKRAQFNARSGHYSVYEHGHITFLIQCSKAVAMILNSTRLYATSERSARYTFMKAETQLENDLYDKWKGTFRKLISAYYDPVLTDKEIDKLSMENARYMISIFTNTTMEFTVPYSRAILLCEWLDEFAKYIMVVVDGSNIIKAKEILTMNKIFYPRLAEECRELANSIREAIDIDVNNPPLKDHKNMGITLFSVVNYIRIRASLGLPHNIESVEANRVFINRREYYGDIYTSNYSASLASIAQLQRHRTLSFEILMKNKVECYIPDIIKSTPYETEWIKDFNSLIEAGICPQGLTLTVSEQGKFDDFVLKCKERLCARVQYETMKIVERQVQEFDLTASVNLSPLNRSILKTMIGEDGRVLNRCRFTGYTCKEPCIMGGTNYIRNV